MIGTLYLCGNFQEEISGLNSPIENFATDHVIIYLTITKLTNLSIRAERRPLSLASEGFSSINRPQPRRPAPPLSRTASGRGEQTTSVSA